MLRWIGITTVGLSAVISFYLALLGFSLGETSAWLFGAFGLFFSLLLAALIRPLFSTAPREEPQPVVFPNHVFLMTIVILTVVTVVSLVLFSYLGKTG